MKRFLVPSLLVLALVLAACSTAEVTEAPVVVEPTAMPVVTEEPMEEMPKSITEIAVEDGRFTTLVTALEAADLAGTLAGEGSFTVFAPTDDAFAALPEGTVAALLEDIPALTDILLYHVVDGAVFAETVVTLDSATTLQGEEVAIIVENGMVKVNDANVIITDIEASNGVIHVLDADILPPADDAAMTPLSITEIAVEDGRFTTLVAALEAADLAGTLAGEGSFTVFAPTDDAFAALPEGTVAALLEDIPALTDILLYHVVDGAVFAETVVTLDSATTLQGQDVAIVVEDGMVKVNDANVIITDIEASNGVIHVLDAVILPPTDDAAMTPLSITEIAVEDGRFTTLVAALEAADLAGTLAGEGSFTVFAPTDDAFAALPEGTLDALLEDIPALTDILLYHVVDGAVFAETVVTLDSATTLQGQHVTIVVEDGMVKVNDANVIITDIEASNGVIHVVDAVILPPG